MNEQNRFKEALNEIPVPTTELDAILSDAFKKEKKEVEFPFKRMVKIFLLAASIVLALGLTATLSPTFAQFIGGMFSTKQVDEGLKLASDVGLGERVNLEVSDQDLTFKVEDIIVDSSRVALSLQVINENGIAERPNINESIKGNHISVTGYNGEYSYTMGYMMDRGLDYNSFQVFTSDEPGLEKVTIKFLLVELNGKQGNWELEIPVELTDSNDNTKKVILNNAGQNFNGVAVNLKEIQYAPTSNSLLYETSYESSEQVEIEGYFETLKEQFAFDINDFYNFGTSIKYHIENDEKEVILKFSPFTLEEPMDRNLIISKAGGKAKIGHASRKEVFVPERIDSNLTFVLDGVYKVIPTDFSVKFNPKKIKNQPVSFNYMGNGVTIKKAGLESVTNASDPANFEIEMEVNKESEAAELGMWVLMDETGKSYRVDNETTHKGKDNYKRTIYFKSNGLSDIPGELSLHLLSATSYYEIEDKWRVPLYE